MRRLILLAACLVAACDLDVYPAATPISPGAITITNTTTNTNTNTNTVDRSDTDPVATPAPSSSSGGGGALPLPTYGEGVTREYAAVHLDQVTHSCQLVDGDAAWAFLDGLISLLQARDARWGYLCKDASCTTLGRDVITYKASAGDVGIWIVDVLGNHCPGPNDSPTQVRWGVLPFETLRRWAAARK
jgi:hypothetical protein